MPGTKCTCEQLPEEQPNPPGILCRICQPDEPGCTALGEVDGTWCAEHCAAAHYGDEQCGPVPAEGTQVAGSHCACSRPQAQQAPGAPGAPVSIPVGGAPSAPGAPGPGAPAESPGAPGAVSAANFGTDTCGKLLLTLFAAFWLL